VRRDEEVVHPRRIRARACHDEGVGIGREAFGVVYAVVRGGGNRVRCSVNEGRAIVEGDGGDCGAGIGCG
jgi:hypothetical protein